MEVISMTEKERRLWWKQRRAAAARKEARRQAAEAAGLPIYEFVRQQKQQNLIASENENGNGNYQEVGVQ